jgi:hypothetical protein
MAETRSRRSRPVLQTTQEAVIVVTSSGVGIGEEKRKSLEVRKFETEPAYVRVNAGVTKNLGNYESLRVDVSLTVPCYVEEIEQVQTRTAELVAKMLDDEVEEYLGKE